MKQVATKASECKPDELVLRAKITQKVTGTTYNQSSYVQKTSTTLDVIIDKFKLTSYKSFIMCKIPSIVFMNKILHIMNNRLIKTERFLT